MSPYPMTEGAVTIEIKYYKCTRNLYAPSTFFLHHNGYRTFVCRFLTIVFHTALTTD